MRANFVCIVFISFLISGMLSAQEWNWAFSAGGLSLERGWDIDYDLDGNIYITGSFADTSYFADQTFICRGINDVFTAKLSPTGELLWAKQGGGPADDVGIGIGCDSLGNAYITGYYTDEITFDNITLPGLGSWDTFIAKYDPSGNLLWAKRGASDLLDVGYGITTDKYGNSTITGWFVGTAHYDDSTLTSYGGGDIFVVRYDSNGNVLWARNAGGVSEDYGFKLETDDSGNCYVTGVLSGQVNFDTLTVNSFGGFVAKYNNSGVIQWVATSLGAGSIQIDCDQEGNAYMTGRLTGTAYFGDIVCSSNGDSDDIYFAKVENGTWAWVKQFGGNGTEKGKAIRLGDDNKIYIAATFEDSLIIGSDVYYSHGDADILVAGFDPNGNYLWSTVAGNAQQQVPTDITITTEDKVVITGWFAGVLGFDEHFISSSNDYDYNVFAAQMDAPIKEDDQANTVDSAGLRITNYPNPFNPTTILSFTLLKQEKVKLQIFDAKGRLVKTLYTGSLSQGNHNFMWNGCNNLGRSMPSGIYFSKLSYGKEKQYHKMVLLK